MSSTKETLIIDMPTPGEADTALLGGLMLQAMQHTFCDLMASYKNLDRANQGMDRLFGEIWDAGKERIWQWYDLEVTNEVD